MACSSSTSSSAAPLQPVVASLSGPEHAHARVLADIEDRRLDQEVAHRRRLCVERNLREIVADLPRGTAKAGNGALAIGLVPQREVREVEPGGPSLGLLVQDGGGPS